MLKNLLVVTVLIFTQSFVVIAQKPGSLTAIELDGTDDYVAIPDNSALNPSAKITVEAWIKADAYASTNYGNSILCKHGWATGNKGYVLRCGDNGRAGFNIANASGTWVETFSPQIMKTGIWYHVAGVFNGDSVLIFINGNLEASTVYSGTMSPSTGLAPKIGDLAYSVGGTRYFKGQIDEVRVWNTALTKATIRDWMCRKVSNTHPYYSNLAGYYKLDDATGTSATDQSANANTATLNNGPKWVNSGAVLGDSSAHTYGGKIVDLKTKFGDVFSVKNIKNSPASVHTVVYYGITSQQPNFNVKGSIDSSHYFGVYYVDNSSVNFDINYNFKNYAKASSAKCKVNMFSKPHGNTGNWDYTASKFFDNGDSIEIKKQTNKEFIMAQFEPDSNKILVNPTGINWFCGGDSLFLMAADKDSFTYSWYKNGNLINGKTKKTLWVTADGNYRVKLTRSGASSCGFMSAGLAISSRKTNVTWSYSLTTCQNSDSVMLTSGSPSGGYYSGKTVTSNGYFHPKLAGSGKHTLVYNFIDTNNCVQKVSNVVTLLDTIKLTKTSIPDACFGSAPIALNNVSPTGGNYQGKGVTASTFSPITAGVGTHTITYIYTNSNACKSKYLFTISINKPDSISVKLKDKACDYDAPITVSLYPANGVLKGGAVIAQMFYPLFAGKGTHWVYYSITDSHQCEVKDSAKIYISGSPKASIKSFSSVCDNAHDFKLTGGQPADSGKYMAGGLFTDKFSPKIVGKGLHKIEYKVVNYFGCRDSASTFIRVNASPVKPVITVTGNTLTSSATKGNQWMNKNGEIVGAEQQNYNPTVDGLYLVRVTNDSNCSNTSDTFQFKKVGIKLTFKSTISIFPNPSNNGVFFIEGLPANSHIKVIDILGHELVDFKNEKSNTIIDLNNFGSGTYFMSIKRGEEFYNYRLVVL
ncbi:MAG: LamG-like jellyroll fold domain-containing protein [Bacteroidia bacterium]